MELRILVSRADRIGDLVLTLPAISWLKKSTGAHVTLHCSGYAKDIGEWAQHNGVVDDLLHQDAMGNWNQPLRKFDLCLSFFHCAAIRDLLQKIDVSDTIGPRTKISAIWTYCKSYAQHRSRVDKSEMMYNLELAQHALNHWRLPMGTFDGLPKLAVPAKWLEGYEAPRGLVVSVSNGGSAQNWALGDYLDWVEKNAGDAPVDFLVAGADAGHRRAELLAWPHFDAKLHHVIDPLPSVGHLVGYLSQADRLVASSTGPLHIAFAAGVDVLGIYPKKKVESFKRWRPDGYWHNGEVRWIEISK